MMYFIPYYGNISSGYLNVMDTFLCIEMCFLYLNVVVALLVSKWCLSVCTIKGFSIVWF